MDTIVSNMSKMCPRRFKVKLKAVLIGVTLISLYYSGYSLIISCSFVKSAGIATATEYNGAMHQHRLSDLDQLYRKQEQQQHPQANDIFTMLTQPQGRINDDNHVDNEEDINDVSTPGGKRRGSKKGSTAGNNVVRNSPQQSNSLALSCRDEQGNDVNWYIAYKLPAIHESGDPLLKEGSKYYYLIPSEKTWVSSGYPIYDNKSVLGNTLGPLWTSSHTQNESTARLIYNDQPPSQPAVVMNGHTKGAVLTTSEGGFWLQHSCPHFPNVMSPNFTSSYPIGGLINGQMFFCMSLKNVSQVDVLGNILQYTKPAIYHSYVPTTLKNLLPQLNKVATKNATVKKAPWFNIYQLQAGDLQLSIFTKGPKFRKEIYSDWISPHFETSLDVQSWLNGPHPFLSNCTSANLTVLNVLMKTIGGATFSNLNDHSKWAVSTMLENPISCVGDLNRMKPQKTRGGVAVCVSNVQIWSAFKSIVEATQPCNKTESHETFAHLKKCVRLRNQSPSAEFKQHVQTNKKLASPSHLIFNKSTDFLLV